MTGEESNSRNGAGEENDKYCVKIMCDSCSSQYTSTYFRDMMEVISYIIKEQNRPKGDNCTHDDVRIWEDGKQIFGSIHMVGYYVGFDDEFRNPENIVQCQSCGRKFPKPEGFDEGENWSCSDCYDWR